MIKAANIVFGIAILLFSGIIYGWTILSGYIALEFPNWSSSALALAFTIGVAFFCLGGLVSALSGKKLSAKSKLLIAAVMFLIGFGGASQTSSLAGLYLTYSVFCGSGAGFAYNAIMTTVPLWSPNNQGFLSGAMLMGFGSSSLIICSAFTAFTPDTVGAWRTSFLALGVCIFVIMMVGAFIIRLPETTVKAGAVATSEQKNYTPTQMLKTIAFWQYFIWVLLISLVGLAVIGQARGIIDLLDSGLSTSGIVLAVGLISIFNGLGRIFFGAISDKYGWRVAMIGINCLAICSVLVIICGIMLNSVIVLVPALWFVGSCFGGGACMCAVYIKQFFGMKYFSINFQLVLLNLLISSFGGTIAAMLYDISGGYISTCVVLLVCTAVAMIAPLTIKAK